MRFLTSLLFCALAACSKAPEMPPKIVEVENVTKAPFAFSIGLVGVIKPKFESFLTAKMAGAVDTHVLPGAVAKKGDVIASIQNADAEKNYELASMEATIAKEQYDRAQKLGNTKTVSKQEVEVKRMEAIRAEKQAFEAKRRLEDSQFIMPFDGVVGVFKVREGAHMNAGDVLVTVYKPGHLVITCDVPEEFVAKVNAGQKALIEGKSFPVTGIQKLIDPESHMGPAFIDYACDDCIVGSNIDVDLIIFEDPAAISVPKEAIYTTPEQSFVYLVKDGKAALQLVKVGHTYQERTQIIEGLNVGDSVVSKGITRLFPGLDVQIYEKDKPEGGGDKKAPASHKN